MQRVSAFLPTWDKRESGTGTGTPSKAPGGRPWWPNRTSSSSNGHGLARINVAAANSNRIQKEAFWPANLELECDKAARILKSFCTDGYLSPLYDEPPLPSSSDEPSTPIKVPKRIPKRILQNAAGIAVFTCMRSGLWMTGSGGSGILIARKSDGTWSPPSAIMLHTPTLSFIIGVDVYDCVLVVNNLAALESITRPRVTLGEDVRLSGGLSVPLESSEADIVRKDLGNTVLTYLKARGQHQTVNLHGCILTERSNENERFYGPEATQMDILAGNVTRHVEETKPLFEVIKMAEGRTDFDTALISRMATEPAPGDALIATPKSTSASPRHNFGVPKTGDPDPFGVLALEMAGLEIREAGNHLRPASSQFDFNPTPTSPAFSKFRQSTETGATKSNRGSYMSTRTTKSQATDVGTQTAVHTTPNTSPSSGQSEDGVERPSIDHITEIKDEDGDADYTRVDTTPLRHISQGTSLDESPLNRDDVRDPVVLDSAAAHAVDVERVSDSPEAFPELVVEDDQGDSDDTNDADDEDDEFGEEEPVVFEVAAVQPAKTQAVASRLIQAKGSMVTIPKRLPPPLPERSSRRSRGSKASMGGDVTPLRSPLRPAFEETDVGAGEHDEEADEVEHSEVVIEVTQPEEPLDANLGSNDAEAESAELQGETSGTEQHQWEDHEITGSAVETSQVTEPVMEETTIEHLKAEDSKAEDSRAEDSKAEDSETEDLKAEDPKTENLKAMDYQTEEVQNEMGQAQGSGADSPLPDETSQDDFHDVESEKSDTISKKRASSVCTGVAEDQWSHAGSSVTTPTSDRPHSGIEEGSEKVAEVDVSDKAHDTPDDMDTPMPGAFH